MIRAHALVLSLALGACGETADPSPGTPPPASAAALAPASGADAGLSELAAKLGPSVPFEVTAARPNAAQACMRGEVAELDVLLCRYASPAELDAAKPKLQAFVAGALSGVVRQRGDMAMAVADRAKVDPTGKVISQLVERFESSP